jgi:hypothetical protein
VKLHELLRSVFDEDECRMFLIDTFDQSGQDIWDSTHGSWMDRSHQIDLEMRKQGLKDRRLFEALVRRFPKRADDIAAVCKAETNQPFSYTSEEAPPAREFPWSDYREAMSPGLIRMLRLGAYDARSHGQTTISTSEVFRVYRALQPWIAASFPHTDIESADLMHEEDPFDGTLGASFCVSKTIHGLAEKTERPSLITEHDVFLDLARFGAGESARKLAPDGGWLDRINEYSRQLGIGRVTRHGPLD